MKVHPRNWLLLAVLAALVGAHLALERPVTTQASAGPLVPGLAVARVAVVRIEGPSDEGGRVCTLERRDDGWTVAERWDHPAEDVAVLDLLAKVAALSLADRVGTEAEAHGRFGVGSTDDATRLVLEDASGAVLADLLQGLPRGESGGSYVRPSLGADVVRAARLEVAPADPRAWLDTRLVDFDPAEATQVTVHHEGGRVFLDLMRTEDGWVDVSREGAPRASRLAVERLLTVASTLWFEDVAGTELRPNDGFGSPPETLVEVTVGDRIASVWIGFPIPPQEGGEGEEPAYLATEPHGAKTWVVRLPAASARVLFAAIEALAP